MADQLFYGHGELSDALRAKRDELNSYAAGLRAAQLNGASDAEMVAHVVERFHIEPLAVHTANATGTPRETQIDVSRDEDRFVPDRSRPCMITGTSIDVAVPFEGDAGLLRLTPNTRNFSPPRGTVGFDGRGGGTITLSFAAPHGADGEALNRRIQSELKNLATHADWSRTDISAYNASLQGQAQGAIASRRAQLEKQGQLLSKLTIPLRRAADAPSPVPVPMPKRVLKPLPSPRSVEQEFQISDADYEYILNVIRHQSRSFEQTPSACQKLDEEELRDMLLASLNTHFEGGAAGERFRKRGKTDVCIEFESRAAFVGECKHWSGPRSLSDAVDQLLGYLTWRDCRAALVLFNKSVKGFKALQDGMGALLSAHTSYVQQLTSGHAGEWRVVFKARDDDARLVTVHVFLVDLLFEPAGA